MAREPMKITNSDYELIGEAIMDVKRSGTTIRKTFAPYNENGEYDTEMIIDSFIEQLEELTGDTIRLTIERGQGNG